MAPARSSTRRGAQTASASHHEAAQDLQNDGHNATELFLDPNFGSPLQIYIEKDVDDKDILSQLIQVFCFPIIEPDNSDFLMQKHGGTVSPVYSRANVAYILGTNSLFNEATHSNSVFQWIHIKFLAKIFSNNMPTRKVKSSWTPVGLMNALKQTHF